MPVAVSPRACASPPSSSPASAPAAAQDFYKGKQVSILVAGTAGGGIDIGARVMARHLGKYIPGNPNVVAQLMPGAGGIRMIDHMNQVAPQDGTVIGTVAPGPIIEPLIGKRKIGYRMTDFTMLGGDGQGRDALHRLGRVEVQDHPGRDGRRR